MTFDEILKSCSSGKLPRVTTNIEVPYTSHVTGTITTIKQNSRHCGVGVTFDGLAYEVWHHDSKDNDKRSRYIRNLSLLDE